MNTPPLWAHQEADIKRYINHGSLFNASDPGTGKTRTIIETVRRTKQNTLILAPKSILQCAWGNDFNRFAPEISYSVATASNRATAFGAGAQVVITNHDAIKFLEDNPKYLKNYEGGFLVVDESTAFKNPKSQRTKAITKLRERFAMATCMSGTPTPQGIIDLWAQMYLVDQGAHLGKSYYRYRAEVMTPMQRGSFTEWREKPGIASIISDIVSDIVIRNRREDCMDLPPNQTIEYEFELTPSHLKAYHQMRREALLELESGDVAALNAASKLTKLLQILSGAVYDEDKIVHEVSSARYELVMDLAEERQQCLVVFNWRHQLVALKRLAEKRGLSYGWIAGDVSSKQRGEYVDQFQDGKLRVLFVHPQSAGHGLTLTAGTATIWASPTYNAELYEQTNARIFRGGQTQKTETILVKAKNTIEADVYQKLNEKRISMADVLEIFAGG
jgi:SNF2 family DNA or RNA helicase